ncbi:MAG TPA: radical SAM protein, partial [Myxococcota bacterium]|nr:radical SAM protein [Myxococcota bacterium]
MRPAYDLRVVPISSSMLMVELAREHAPCRMYCRFCPRTANGDPRDLPPPSDEDQARVLRDFRRLLETSDATELFLWSDDLLRYPGLDDLLDAARGLRLHVVTPGLELADRAFAERFVGRDLRFDLTVHALDPETFTAMCGNPDAHGLVMAAIDNLRALGVPHQLAIVVTDVNVHALADTLLGMRARWGAERVYVRVFYPDALHLPAGYERQFPSFDAVMEQLERAGRLGEAPAVFLSNVPPCQVDLDRLDRPQVFLTPHFNAFRAPDLPACAACPAADVCPR